MEGIGVSHRNSVLSLTTQLRYNSVVFKTITFAFYCGGQLGGLFTKKVNPAGGGNRVGRNEALNLLDA
jgi:hypothetical protein